MKRLLAFGVLALALSFGAAACAPPTGVINCDITYKFDDQGRKVGETKRCVLEKPQQKKSE
jgi:hypothetical protein